MSTEDLIVEPPQPIEDASVLPSPKRTAEEDAAALDPKRVKGEPHANGESMLPPASTAEGPAAAEPSPSEGGPPPSDSSQPTTPAPKPPAQPDLNNLPPNPMPKHQAKHALTTIKAIRRLKDAGPFLLPVDIIKLGIPFYYNYIPQPMDLSTMEKKITANAYEQPEQLTLDFALMVANCTKFNGADSAIAQMARNIQASFEKHMLHMPPRTLPLGGRLPNGAEAAKSTKGLRAKGAAEVPVIRREASEGGRPKREIHPPKPKDLPYDNRPRKKKYVAELRFSGVVLKELMSKKYESFSYPFVEPVNPTALGILDYFDVVKNPMDLSKVQSKLQNNEYETADEFEADVRLVFQNCYAYNPEGTPVNLMGHRLEAIFDKRWEERPAMLSSPAGSEEETDDSGDEIDEALLTNTEIEFLEAQLDKMRTKVDKMALELELKKKELYERILKQKLAKRKTKTKKKKKAVVVEREISYEMKKELSDKMGELSEKKLQYVIQLIRESIPDLNNNGQEEIELDMDQLDNSTLMKMYNFVFKKKVANAGRRNSVSLGNGKKKKVLTEAENSKKIEDLRKTLLQFDKVGEAPSSSDDDSSDESSEEE